MRINKLLSNYGYCSRKDVRKLIDDERIIINGKLAEQGQWVEVDDEVLVDGIKVEKKENIYLVLNKPVGIICTADENKDNNIIKYMNCEDYIFPVGRLDKDSQGLIILTNDGELANKILEAENGHEKEYIVQVDREINEDFIYKMSNGLEIDGQVTKTCYVEKLENTIFKIILTQGLNRQIRKMCLKIGYKVQKLERIRILNIEIENLEYGKFRDITCDELEKLKQIID
ncbi:MAG: pseudouridine synthase [Sarcina sp.]